MERNTTFSGLFDDDGDPAEDKETAPEGVPGLLSDSGGEAVALSEIDELFPAGETDDPDSTEDPAKQADDSEDDDTHYLMSLSDRGVHIEDPEIFKKMEKLSLSPSTVAAMEQCPAKWVFEKYAKKEIVPDEEDTPARRGNVFHDIMENFFMLEPADRTTAELTAITKSVITNKYPEFKSNGEVINWTKDAIEGYYKMGGSPKRVKIADVPKHKNYPDSKDEMIPGLEIFVKGKLGEATRETLGFIDQVVEDPEEDGAVIVSDWKGLALDTPIPTYTGWTTMGQVAVGDKIIGTDGGEISVTRKSSVHNRDCYKITFFDDSSVISDNVHLWKIRFGYSANKAAYTETVDTDELYRRSKTLDKQSLQIENPKAIQFEYKDGLPIDPYVLGIWLGEDDSESLSDDVLKRENLLHNKHIPADYLRSSIEQRLELLRGLMDSDGYWNPTRNRALFYTTTKALADGVSEIIFSLGITPTINRGENEHKGYYEIGFIPVEHNPFKLPRKADLAQQYLETHDGTKHKARHRYIRDIEKIDSVPTQCIQVDAEDSMFLCGESMVPTHNSGAKFKEFKKTTKSNDGFNEVRQQIIYSMLMEQKDVNVSSARLIYPVARKVINVDIHDQEIRLRIIDSIERADQRLNESIESNTFEYGPSFLCSWCPLVRLCPVGDKRPFKKAVDARKTQPTPKELLGPGALYYK